MGAGKKGGGGLLGDVNRTKGAGQTETSEKRKQRREAIDQRRETVYRHLSEEDGGRAGVNAEVEGLVQELELYQAELEAQDDELREAQSNIAEVRDQYIELFEASPVGYVLLDQHGLIRQVNAAGVELLGIERVWLEGRLFVRSVHKEDHRALAKGCARERPGEPKRGVGCEVRLVRPDGEIRHVQIRTRLINGRIFGEPMRLLTLADVTSLKAAESELRHRQEDLRMSHRQVSEQLGTTSEELRHEVVEGEKTKAALATTERQYQLMVENIEDGIIITQDYRFKFTNRKAAEVLGGPREELRDALFVPYVHEDDRERVATIYRARLEGTASPKPYEFRMYGAGGKIHWLRNLSVLIQWDGRPAVLSVLRDVTEQREMQEQLDRQRVLLETILAYIPVMVAMYDEAGNITFMNQEFERAFGWTAEDLAQTHALRLLVPDEERRSQVETHLLTGGIGWQDFVGTTKEGTQLATSWSTVQLPDGRRLGIGIDVQQRKEMEEQLQQERGVLKTILDNIPVMIVLFGAEGKVQLVNANIEQVLGWTKEDFEEQDVMSLCCPDPEQRDEVERFMRSCSPNWQDFEMMSKEGEAVATSWITVCLPDSRIIGIGLDVRFRRKAEEVLLGVNRQLEGERNSLRRKNITLREVLSQYESRQKEIRETIAMNIDEAVVPTLQEIKERTSDEGVRRTIEVVEKELAEISSPLVSRLKKQFGKLTVREREVALMLRQGMNTKGIAEALALSEPTIGKYREAIRKKLELTGSKMNLQVYLQMLEEE